MDDALGRIGAVLDAGEREALRIQRLGLWEDAPGRAAAVRADARHRAAIIAGHALHGAAVRVGDAAELASWDAGRERVEFETVNDHREQADLSDRLLVLRQLEHAGLLAELQRLGLGDGGEY